MSLDGIASLLVASSDLKLVQSIRGAMAAATNGAPIGPLGTFVDGDRFEPRRVIHPEPRFEPRPVYHPTPRFEPRPVIHPTPRLGEAKELPPKAISSAPLAEPEEPRITDSPCKAPWQMPLPLPPEPTKFRTVKIVRRQPDIVHKGTMIDVFI